MRWICGISAIALCLALPAHARPVPHQEKIDQLVAAYVAAFNKHDVAGTAALFTADAVIVSATAPSLGVNVENGHEAITQYLEQQFHDGAHLNSFTEDQVQEVRRSVIMVVGQWRAVGNSPGGHYDLTGHWTGIVVRIAHDWRIRLLTAFPS